MKRSSSCAAVAVLTLFLNLQPALAADLTITPDSSSPSVVSSVDDLILDTTSGSTGDIGSSASPFEIENSNFSSPIDVDSITANLDDGDVYLNGSDLNYSGDITISPSNTSHELYFDQDVTYTGGGSTSVSDGIVNFQGQFDLGNSTLTVSDALLAFSSFIALEVNSISDFGRLTASGSLRQLSFESGSFLQFEVGNSVIADDYVVIDNFFGIGSTPDTVAVSYNGDDQVLTQDVTDSTFYSGTVGGADFSFDLVSGTLTVVPEPTSAALLGGAALLLACRRRRQRLHLRRKRRQAEGFVPFG